MKLTAIGFICLFVQFGFSQKIELRLSSAYSVSAPNSILGKQQININNSDFSVSNISGNFASGLSYAIQSNIRVHSNLKLGIIYDYFKGSNLLISNLENANSSYVSWGFATQHRIIPTITFDVNYDRIVFYASSGLLLPMKTISKAFIEDSGYFTTGAFTKSTEFYDYKFTFGYRNAIGFEIKLNEQWKLNSQLESILLSLQLKSKKIIAYQQNDQDVLSNLSAYDKETIYRVDLNNFSNNSAYNTNYDVNKIKDELVNTINFNSLAIRFGITYCFKNKK